MKAIAVKLSDNGYIIEEDNVPIDPEDPIVDLLLRWKVESALVLRLANPSRPYDGVIILQVEKGDKYHCHPWTKQERQFLEDISTQVELAFGRLHLIELDKARDIAEKASRTKSNFLAVVSHEVR